MIIKIVSSRAEASSWKVKKSIPNRGRKNRKMAELVKRAFLFGTV